MVAFAGRVESRFTVPTGGAAASVSVGALSSAVTVTVPAANYFHTAAGGVSSWATTFQTQLNATVSPYPDNATSIAAAVGYGTWDAGWGFDIASGNDTGLFGGVTLTATGTSTYSITGPANGGDKAVRMDAAADGFTASTADVGASDDIAIFAVVRTATPSANSYVFSKQNYGTADAGYYLTINTSLQAVLTTRDGADVAQAIGSAMPADTWVAIGAVLDRGATAVRIGWTSLSSVSAAVSSATSTSAVGSLSNAQTFNVAARGTLGGNLDIAALYLAFGSGAAANMSTNLATAINNFANAVNSGFTVSLDTASLTGRYTVSNSFWPFSISWTDTDQRDLAGYAYNIDYPATAAQMATALGYGTWTNGAGYLCNESSGDLSAVFGSPATLTASSTPTYSNVGARGGTDKAIGFDSAADQFAGGASDFDAGASDDLIALWVGHVSGTPAGGNMLASKGAAGDPARWAVYHDTDDKLYAELVWSGGSATASVNISALYGEMVVVIASLDRATGKVSVGAIGIRSGTSAVSAEATVAASSLSGSTTFKLGNRGAVAAALMWKFSYVALVTGSGVATGLSANLSTALSSFATYMKSQTGTQQAKGLWLPDCPLNIQGNPSQAPRVTDLRQSEGPTGIVLGLAGNSKYRHRGISWMAVPKAQVWESDATYTNGSWQTFCDDAIFGVGHAWFTPSSRVQIYWDNAGTVEAVGSEYNSGAGISGWYIKGISSCEPALTSPPWTGLYRIEIPEIVSDG